MEPALDVTLVLIRDGPEGECFLAELSRECADDACTGSSRLSSACLSDLLRHLSLFLLRHAPTNEKSKGEEVARAYLLVAKFIEGICADRVSLVSLSYSSAPR